MPLGSWEPNFSWDDASAEFTWTTWSHQHSAITALYECLKVAFGPAATMDEARQDRSRRRKTTAEIEETTNDGINYQAAKMTKCIVNYMASGADSTVFEQENLLRTQAGVTGATAGLEVLGGFMPGTGEILFEADDENLVDLYWEIDYMKAPASTISIGDPPDHLRDDA